ncbi:MAG: CHASE2 domain-containing protein, partial [Proteobacteria bacterium]|nr:CHASE2 domain-containing protein [Pseudomonadota bacterium]
MIFGKNFIKGLVVGLAGAVLALGLWGAGWLDTWEAKTWDWRAAFWAAPGPATDDIRLILLDQNSLDWAQSENGLSWPWPREVYAAVINFCRRSGARALAFDVLYTEPSKYGVEDDAAFGAAVSEFGYIAGAVFLGETSGSETRWPPNIPASRIKVTGLNQWLDLTGAKGIILPRATLPIPELARNAAVLCNVHLNP